MSTALTGTQIKNTYSRCLIISGSTINGSLSIVADGLGNDSALQLSTGQVVVASSNAAAFSAGPNGDTNPTLRVVTNTSSGATGLSITNAAAGGGVTIQALSSGTYDGILLNPKGTYGDSAYAAVMWKNECFLRAGAGSDTYGFLYSPANDGGRLRVYANSGETAAFTTYPGLNLATGSLQWGTGFYYGNIDVAIQYNAAGVIEVNSGSGTPGTHRWLLQAGHTRVTSDVTNATATMANLTDLSVSLLAGMKFHGRLVLKCQDSTAAEGISIDFDGGSATMTSFIAGASVLTGGTTVAVTTVSSALATDLNWTTITGETWIVVEFSGVVNAAGTFIPRFCQGTAHTTGTATVYAGSKMTIDYSAN